MKKLIILTAALLFGVGSICAQGAWEVKVTWSISGNSDCEFTNPDDDIFVIAITIYDAANDIIVVQDAVNEEAYTVFETTFDVQTAVQTHCNDNTLQNNPGFIIYTKVRMVDSSVPSTYCSMKSTTPNKYCSDFSGGLLIPELIFD